jgi:predicted RNase H-like nuclease (RuvC/YqgF family)
MRPIFRNSIWLAGLVVSLGALSSGQSLGDVAREQRQKQQAKKAQVTPKVVTNEDMPEHPESSDRAASGETSGEGAPSRSMGSKSAEEWKEEIAEQRRSVDNLQTQIDRLNSSIHFAPGNCVRNCVQYNEHQVDKQEEVQRMQSELQEQKKKLEDMQEAARKEGFGNSVYEP